MFLKIYAAFVPTCTYVPRQLSPESLETLLPAKWMTQYENFHGRNKAITAAERVYLKQSDGSVETSFIQSKKAPDPPNPFVTEANLTELSIPQTPTENHMLLLLQQGHQAVDCTCEACNEDSYQIELELEQERSLYPKSQSHKHSQQQFLQERFEKGDPEAGLLGEHSGKFDYYVLYPISQFSSPTALPPDNWGESPPPPPPLPPYYQKALSCLHETSPNGPIAPRPTLLDCCMFSPSSSTYHEHFPAVEEFELPQQNTKHSWKIKTPAGKNSDGTPKRISPAEASLNWQVENAVKQNQILTKILENQTKLETSVTKQLTALDALIQDLGAKIVDLKAELSHIARTVKDYYQAVELIRIKEAEKKHLENQLRTLEASQQKEQPQASPPPPARSLSLYESTHSVFQPLPPQPYTPAIGFQPLPIIPIEPHSLFPKSYHHVLKAPPTQTSSSSNLSTQVSSKPLPPDPTTGASSRAPPNLFPLKPFSPISSYLNHLASSPLTPLPLPDPNPTYHTLTSHFDNLMMETNETEPQPNVTEPNITEPGDGAESPPPPPTPPTFDQNRFFTLEDIPPLLMENSDP